MKIGFLGAGSVAIALSTLMQEAGHETFLGARTSGNGSLHEAVQFGEVIAIAIPYDACANELPKLTADLKDKTVIDITNPVQSDWSPLLLGQENSAAETIAKLLPQSKIVKAFNTIFADVMNKKGMNRDGRIITSFVASDDEKAAATVATLAKTIGFAPVVTGPLKTSRYLEAMAHLNIAIAVEQKGGTNAAFIYSRGY
jgi:8-hydroxy-5-deazaflavin:NADPH oxidoreductase